jgi:FkbM family methyltransferase
MPLSLYTTKKILLTPRTVYKRRTTKDLDPATRMMFEQNYYRQPMFDFLVATMMKPDILTDHAIGPDSVVLDVGAFIGDWSEKISTRYGSVIHAFEPGPSALRQMAERLDDHPNVHQHPYGLGRRDETASLALSGPGSTIYADSGTYGTVEVPIRDAVAVLDELGLDHVDLLKVNIEGGEYDLIDRLDEAGWLPRIDLLMVQFHEFHPKAYRRRRHNRRSLARTHEQVWDYPWIWEYWRRRT